MLAGLAAATSYPIVTADLGAGVRYPFCAGVEPTGDQYAAAQMWEFGAAMASRARTARFALGEEHAEQVLGARWDPAELLRRPAEFGVLGSEWRLRRPEL